MRKKVLIVIIILFGCILLYLSQEFIVPLFKTFGIHEVRIQRVNDFFQFSINLTFGFLLGVFYMPILYKRKLFTIPPKSVLKDCIIIFLGIFSSLIINILLFKKNESGISHIYLREATTLWVEFPVITLFLVLYHRFFHIDK